MAARIREDDIAAVRERARIDEVIEQYVTLRNAGGGSRKGLCPFHDEKSPSFNVTPARGMYYCFGCGEGGDVFTFLQKIDQITFTEAVERLAAKCGITLTYVDGPAGPQRDFAQRGRLVSANKAAAEYYADQLATERVAVTGRQFLADRGFDRDAAERFGVGFAPRDGEALYRHLRGRGFDDNDLIAAGLVARGNRGPYDRFRGRLVWPIREASGDVVGFGARRLFDDDRIEAKYLNTPETTLYKKSQVLYGVDLARKAISQASQAVIVEGYTDVMACHEAGVLTAVATCGTAFGEDHGRILRRLLLDHEAMHGEVIFTFDGDEAGQKAAMRAFEGDAQFVAQTYVAVQPDALDPCDLRLQKGDAAVRELVSSRIPLYRFVLRNIIARYDLDHADQRVDALRAAVELVSSVRDQGKVDEFVREIAQTVGVELDQVRRELGAARRRPSSARRPARSASTTPSGEKPAGPEGEAPAEAPAPVPNLGDPRYADERELLKVSVQVPHLLVPFADVLDADDFTHPWTAAVWTAIQEEGPPATKDDAWAGRVRDRIPDPQVQRIFAHLAVDPLRVTGEADGLLVDALVARVQELTVVRRIAQVKSKLQRTDPLEAADDYNRMFSDLLALEQQRRQLREKAIGGPLV